MTLYLERNWKQPRIHDSQLSDPILLLTEEAELNIFRDIRQFAVLLDNSPLRASKTFAVSAQSQCFSGLRPGTGMANVFYGFHSNQGLLQKDQESTLAMTKQLDPL